MLDCFYYSRKESVDPAIWAIFRGIERYNSVDGFQIEHVSEMLDAACEGKIDLSRDFNLAAYERKILETEYKNSIKKASKIKFISFADSDTELEGDLRDGGVTLDDVSYMSSKFSDVKSEIDQFFDDEELKSAIDSIQQLNEDFVTEYGVDLVVLLKKAAAGLPQAVAKLKEVCAEFSVVAETIKVILSSGVSVEKCFG